VVTYTRPQLEDCATGSLTPVSPQQKSSRLSAPTSEHWAWSASRASRASCSGRLTRTRQPLCTTRCDYYCSGTRFESGPGCPQWAISVISLSVSKQYRKTSDDQFLPNPYLLIIHYHCVNSFDTNLFGYASDFKWNNSNPHMSHCWSTRYTSIHKPRVLMSVQYGENVFWISVTWCRPTQQPNLYQSYCFVCSY
jgi:hypothetical protein